jgi:pimeloyl-ACP methyl ester carboxylesterase/molybdopterin/thiamine biosynthesis adenylyltransferase
MTKSPTSVPVSFSRNIGILLPEEQGVLARSTVTIAGLGGIGSNVAILLARMGVGRFVFADFDRYELSNINRQYGAAVDTIGRLKVEVVRDEILRINPDAEVTIEPEGVTKENAARLVASCQLCIDAIDFYSIEDHLVFHRAARAANVAVLMGSPVGFSACMQVFEPTGMSLEEYTGIKDGMLPIEKQMRYACGLVPELAHIDYFDVSAGKSGTNFVDKTGPSIACALGLAASLVATEVVLRLLDRRPSRAIPYTHQFDPFTFRYHTTLVAGGMSERDHREALARVTDKSSLIPQVFETLFTKPRAKKHQLASGAVYAKQSAEDGPALLLIPPLGADTSFWAKQYHELARHRRVIAFDPRGTGASSELVESDDTRTMARDLRELLDALGVERVDVVGVALGGLVAQWLATEIPDRVGKLVLFASYLRADEHIEALTELWRTMAMRDGMNAVFDSSVSKILSAAYRQDNESDLKNLRTFLRLNTQAPAQFCLQSLMGVRHDSREVASAIAAPTLVVHGDDDEIVGEHLARDLAQRIPNATLLRVPRGSHFLSWERPDEFNQAIENFLQR